jgi:hypothetical protein
MGLPLAGRLRKLVALQGALLGLSLTAALSLGPLLFERRPISIFTPHANPIVQLTTGWAVLLLMGLALALRASADGLTQAGAGRRMALFAILALLMTAWHWWLVDLGKTPIPSNQPNAGRDYYYISWQSNVYLCVLNRLPEWQGFSYVPHVYRPLPYGFTRTVELVTHYWPFACFSYRWFFNVWFLWATYQFASLFRSPTGAWFVTLFVVGLYPCSVFYYWGQLTDPMSHTFFVLGLIYIVEDRWVAFTAAVALGVLAKETAIILVPAYFACYWRMSLAAWGRSLLAAIMAIAAYVSARWPVGWRPDLRSINATSRLMIGPNLWGDSAYHSAAPIWQNYAFVAVYVGSFLPFILWRWRQQDPRLKAMLLSLTPLLLASNLCFGWLHEARNYLPLVPLLATMALEAL